MTRDDVIRMARDAGLRRFGPLNIDCELERFAALVAAHEREVWPNLDPVIAWLENGCNPQEAAKELRLYSDAIRARGTHEA